MAYASRTKVPVEKTRMEIERMLKAHGMTSFAYATMDGLVKIVFEANDRRVRFTVPIPLRSARMAASVRAQTERSRLRGLLLCIKAKLESVESKIETFEEAFYAHIVLPDGGDTIYERTSKGLALAYSGGQSMPSLLEGPK